MEIDNSLWVVLGAALVFAALFVVAWFANKLHSTVENDMVKALLAEFRAGMQELSKTAMETLAERVEATPTKIDDELLARLRSFLDMQEGGDFEPPAPPVPPTPEPEPTIIDTPTDDSRTTVSFGG